MRRCLNKNNFLFNAFFDMLDADVFTKTTHSCYVFLEFGCGHVLGNRLRRGPGEPPGVIAPPCFLRL